MAHRFWPNQDPLGKRFRSTDLGNTWMEVVGVVKDAKVQWIFADPEPFFYIPIAQHYLSLRMLQLRTAGDPAALAPMVSREIHAMDPHMPLFDVTPMTRTLEGPNGFFLIQMAAMFGGGLGLLGLVLALVGVYGVVSYAASQRTQEIGVRMALGADRSDIVRLVLGRGLLLVIVGIGVGVAIALGASRVVASLLFNVSASDPITFVGVSLLLGAMALVASYVPAWRATRIDPASALKG
jgi:predicted lysophospholipase L1 biosynthesis ABC-type transport system permease subunit